MSRILTVLAIIAVALPSAAAARLRTIAPPGDSSVSQYVESVPSDSGNRPTASLGSHPALTPSQSQALDRAGTGGKTLVAVVDATAPAGGGRNARRAGGAHPGLAPGAISGQGVRSPVSSVLAAAAGDGGGMGFLLPAVMAAVAAGVLSLVFMRRHRTPPPS